MNRDSCLRALTHRQVRFRSNKSYINYLLLFYFFLKIFPSNLLTSRYLFDSHALLAFFQKEKGADVVSKILRKALKQGMDRLICVINLGEIIYMTKRRFGDNKKMEILGRVHQLGFKIL